MHRLEITGATPEELYVNSLNMLSMLVRGSAAITVPAEPATTPSSANDRPAVETRNDGSTPSEGAKSEAPLESSHTVAGKVRRNARGSKNTEPKILNDDIPDLAADAREKDGKPPELTLDGDIRPRLRAIQKACTDRGMNMQDTVAYIMKLYGPFGVQKADQLKPDQFSEFMEASEGYLSGEA